MSFPAFRFPSTGSIRSGAGSLERVGDALVELESQRCLAVVAPSLAREPGFVDRLQTAADGRLTAVFSDVRRHPGYDTVLAAAATGSSADVSAVLAVGGGSTIDTARLAALCIGEEIDSWEALHELRVRLTDDGPAFPAATAAPLPFVAVPMTLSAAELSDGGAAVCPWTRRKELFAGPGLAAAVAILDPQLAVMTPPDVWVTTGVRAVDHAAETILSPRSSPLTDELAARAIALLAEALPATLDDPADVAVRERGQLAAWLSYFGVGLGTLGLSHAVGHQLGARLGIAHGAASCVVLPKSLRFEMPRAGRKAEVLTRAFGGDDPAAAVEDLVGRLGLPHRLRDLGVDAIPVDELVDAVLDDFVVLGTPGGPPRRADLAALLEALR